MTNTNPHSAAGQAAGYEQQRRLALVLLCEAYAFDPAVRVRLEAIEDIDLVSTDAAVDQRVQSKHHLEGYRLTDSSPELWKTLNTWIDLMERTVPDPLPRLILATTSAAVDDSAALLLGPGERNEELALDRLLAVAADGDSQLAKFRRRFQTMEGSAQRRLLSAVTVLDRVVQVDDVRPRLRQALGLVVPSLHATEFLERIEGWWVQRSAELLKGVRESVSGADLQRICDAVRDDYRGASLRLGPEITAEPSEEQKSPLRGRRFVRQLEVVDAPSPMIDLAIRHYFRAFAQRGRWARDLEGEDGQISTYEHALSDEWEVAHLALGLRTGHDAQARCHAGRDFALAFPDQVRARLGDIDDAVLCRGTLHGLADDLTVGWHPDFREYFSASTEAA